MARIDENYEFEEYSNPSPLLERQQTSGGDSEMSTGKADEVREFQIMLQEPEMIDQ